MFSLSVIEHSGPGPDDCRVLCLHVCPNFQLWDVISKLHVCKLCTFLTYIFSIINFNLKKQCTVEFMISVWSYSWPQIHTQSFRWKHMHVISSH